MTHSVIFLHCSEQILPSLNLWEFYGVDVNKVVEELKRALVEKAKASKNSQTALNDSHVSPEVMIVQDPEYRRLGSTIDLRKAVNWYISSRYWTLTAFQLSWITINISL